MVRNVIITFTRLVEPQLVGVKSQYAGHYYQRAGAAEDSGCDGRDGSLFTERRNGRRRPEVAATPAAGAWAGWWEEEGCGMGGGGGN